MADEKDTKKPAKTVDPVFHEELSRVSRLLADVGREREKLESALEEKERALRTTFDSLGDSICLLDNSGRILYANTATQKLLGRTKERLEGFLWTEISPFAGEVTTQILRAFGSGKRASGRLEWRGRFFRVEADPHPGEHGEPGRCVLLIADATAERRAVEKIVQSEGKLRAIFNHSSVGLWLLDVGDHESRKGALAQGSPALERFWGYSQDELEDLSLAELCHPEDLENDAHLLSELLEGLRESYQVEKRFIHKDGHELWGDLSVSVIRTVGGEPEYLVYTLVDITTRKQVEQGMARINEALKAYAHSVSHDLRGPLSGAMAASQVLGMLLNKPITEEVSADIRELAGVFTGSISRSIDLINKLLFLAETEVPSAADAQADLNEVLAEVIADRALLIEERGARVTAERELGTIPVAPAHAYQLLFNLIENALIYSGAPRPEISVHVLPSRRPGKEVRLLVRDNGKGIPAAIKERIFDKFVHGEGGGTGIGLATVRKIAETYGGSVQAYNDNGACFELVLPIREPEPTKPVTATGYRLVKP